MTRKPRYPIKIGQIFGRLTVVSEPVRVAHNRNLHHNCICSCGNEKTVSAGNLRRGHVQSCGCYSRDCKSLRNRGKPKEYSYKYFEYSYKQRAKKCQRIWSLTREQFKELIHKNCYYCDSKPTAKNVYVGKSGKKYYPHTTDAAVALQWIYVNGIDRLDSAKGYTADNSVPCCEMCNYMKLDYSRNDFLNHVAKISNFRKLSNET